MLISKEPEKNLGRLKFGRDVNFQYIVENSGTTPLQITKVGAGCGSCTKTTMRKTKLAVGETSTIDVTFTPGSVGKQNKFVNVEWDKKDTLRLIFTADVYE